MPGFRDLSCLGLFGIWRSGRVVERILLSCCLWYPLVVRTRIIPSRIVRNQSIWRTVGGIV